MTAAEAAAAVEANERLVYLICNKFLAKGMFALGDWDDICQEGRVALWRAALDYDASRGAFSTLACHYIINRMYTVKLDRDRKCRKPSQPLIYADRLVSGDGNSKVPLWHFYPSTIDVEGEVLALTADEVRNLMCAAGCPGMQWERLRDRYEGLKVYEIMERDGCSRQTINAGIGRVRAAIGDKIREIMEG